MLQPQKTSVMRFSQCAWHFNDSALMQYGFAIGEGLDVRPSTHPLIYGGMGLFTTRRFKCGDAVTWYDGQAVLSFVLPRPRDNNDTSIYHHACKIPGTDYTILGLIDPHLGRGGGSFVNHSLIRANTRQKVRKGAFFLASGEKLPAMIVLYATIDIAPDTEIFRDYGFRVCQYLLIPHDS